MRAAQPADVGAQLRIDALAGQFGEGEQRAGFEGRVGVGSTEPLAPFARQMQSLARAEIRLQRSQRRARQFGRGTLAQIRRRRTRSETRVVSAEARDEMTRGRINRAGAHGQAELLRARLQATEPGRRQRHAFLPLHEPVQACRMRAHQSLALLALRRVPHLG